MTRTTLCLAVLTLIFSLQCKRDGDEELYYEPLVDGIYTIGVDEAQLINFTIEPNKAVSVSGKFNDEINFRIEFEGSALKSFEVVNASIIPVTEILDLPSGYEFQFGYVFKPEGIQFNNPGRMIIELAPGIDFSELKGVFFQGGIPYGDQANEIWEVRLTPLLLQTLNGKREITFHVPHFSGFLGFTGSDDFKCGNPVAAEDIEDLQEILACYISGKESLTDKDLNKVNGALRDWMEAGLQWLEDNPSEMDEDWEIDDAISQIVAWKATVLMFNHTLSPFDNLLKRIGNMFTTILIDKLVQADSQCKEFTDLFSQSQSFDNIAPYMILSENLRTAGILNEESGINEINFCNSISKRFYMGPFLDTIPLYIKFDADNYFKDQFLINFPPEQKPAVSRSRSFNVYATNLLGEQMEMFPGKDFEYQDLSGQYILEGTNLTEILTSITDENGVYQPAYSGGNVSFKIQLITSGDKIRVQGGRGLW